MKGALACYVEAARALADAGASLRGDLLIAAVSGEIEKTQQGDAQGAEYRGYATGTSHLVRHGGVADVCILGEPTEQLVVLGHYGSLWARISTSGPYIHTAFSEGRRGENSILRMREVLDAVVEWIPGWESANAYGGENAIVNVGALQGGFGWRVSRTPHRTDLFLDVRVPPAKPMSAARTEVMDLVRSLQARFPDYGVAGEVFVTAPGAEIAEGHPLIAAIDESHAVVFGAPPGRGTTRWFSDASVLTRYGVQTVNYGTSSGLPDPRARREPRHRWTGEDGHGLRPRPPRGSAGRRHEAGDVRGRRRAAPRRARRRRRAVARLRRHARVLRGRHAGGAQRQHVRALGLCGCARPIVPKKFFHTAGNFREHEEESKQVNWSHEIAPWIMFFQNVDAIVGPDEPVVYPEHLTEELDYELELAVVLRKSGKHFGPEEAADYIGGYVIFNDITARDIQRREMVSGVFSFCKAIDTFCPLGPWIVTPDEIANPQRPGDDAARQRRGAPARRTPRT